MKKGALVFLVTIFLLCNYFLLMLSPVLYSGNGVVADSLIKNIVITKDLGGIAEAGDLAQIVEEGMNKGVKRIKVSAYQTKDNVIVCVDSKACNQIVKSKKKLNKITFNQLNKLISAPNTFKKEGGIIIQSLESIIQLINGKTTLVIELNKGSETYPDIEKRAVNLIKKYRAEQWTIIHSLNDSVLLRVHHLDDEIALHKLIIADFPFFYLIYDGEFRITNFEFYDFVDEFSTFYPFTTKKTVDKVHAMNKKINVWTVNDSLKMKRFVNLGVDGVITDFPNYLN